MVFANNYLSSPEKAFVDHAEDVEAGAKRGPKMLHGDRGLAIVGDQRIPLTEEDVRRSAFHCRAIERTMVADFAFSTEQTYPPKNRQGHPCHPRLGLFPPSKPQFSPSIKMFF